MRHFRRFCAVLALACVLSVSSSAGDISCGLTGAAPTASQETVAGDMPNGVESTDALTEFVISLLNLLSLI
jgi:hypothetical protein